jgi:uncharacterized protein YjbJ (UPF0337 family)
MGRNERDTSALTSDNSEGGSAMDKDRVVGSAKQVKGDIKQAVGKATGDAKLKAEGKADKTAGKIQNAVGSVKDALRGK